MVVLYQETGTEPISKGKLNILSLNKVVKRKIN